ncbi:cell division protein ZapA [Gluconobacter kondonii]|uniref:Cell division protein ZapA n=1 Tax=Gluconobacter kondonii TaxID=941463 RepID=A0ABQ5WS74_9PROT|nr:cell division protein ZapA [Gluconobacter kondonii]MBN3868641.1 cell division protein ZapA [Gluconobacter kondonii]MBS1055048.1 cell division protein ZapA [Gluconobacter kondonii]MBS1058352.1 cell division protein ZapA [Gluconobacter kondonii]MBS1066897.1 cell division protein ZapA [Gluconobacter kondonii]MBS1078987.1 cell division protein ZapA [Gluconobacter kondonii]
MGQVSIRLNGYVYNVGCQDGEEAHLYDMARHVEGWLQRARSLGGAASESKTLMMAALLMADEIFELKHRQISPQAEAQIQQAGHLLQREGARQERLVRLAGQAELLASELERTS